MNPSVVENYVSKVNPLQGTASEFQFSTGNTLPIVARPFGMHHWTLQTAKPAWLFHPSHRQLWGVRLTHQPSPWMGDYSSLLITPFHGPMQGKMEHQASAYVLNNCQPNFVRVEMLRYGITCEMSPTERGAIFVFTAQQDEPLKIRFSFEARHALTPALGQKHFSGSIRDADPDPTRKFGLHFHGEFSEKPEDFTSLPDGGWWTFPKAHRRIELRLAGSFIDAEMAAETLRRELKSRGLEDVRAEGADIWNELLGRLPIEAHNEKQERTFYSCLYRCLLFPRFLDEVDPEGKVTHRSPYDDQVHAGPLCTDNGFWDTHRTVYPLFALAYPDKLKVILEGWLNACRQAGWAPKWASPGLKDCMIGTHFDAVVADAVARGITDWNVEEAFSYLWKNATVPSDSGCYGRRELEDYIRFGYIPADKGYHAPVSCTLDYAYNDFCVSQVAQFLGRTKEADILRPRTLNYRNVFDPSVGFMRERLSDGSWKTPFREFAWGGGFVEGGTWQHTFNVPHDPDGLAALFGGPKGLCQKLDAMLALPATFDAEYYGLEIHEMTEMALAGFGQYAHSNQPVHGFLFLYALMGEVEKTSHWVRKVATELYTPDSLPGDEDNGEMSAWYVWATLGLYPQCPGKSGWVQFQPLAKSTPVFPLMTPVIS
jgi:putative alpha-1,2-mannosidase